MELYEKGAAFFSEFLTFEIRFATGPSEAFAALGADGTVDKRLLGFAALGAGLGIAIFEIGSALGMADDTSSSVAFTRALDPKLLPLVAVLFITVLSLAWHALTRAISATWGQWDSAARFDGTALDSVNAGLALGAFVVPMFSLMLVGLRLAEAHASIPIWALACVGFAGAVAFLAYFAGAFAAAHDIPPLRCLLLTGFAVVGISLLRDLIGRITSP